MATDVYYSCSPFGTGDIKTGSPNIEITSGVATLSVAQTGNIGIGCAIEYNSLKVFISAVNSSTSFDVITAVGGTPANQTSVAVTSIHHEYASLSALEAGFTDASHLNSVDLVADDFNFWACCYYDHDDYTKDTTSVTIDFGTIGDTDATRRFNVYVPNGGTESINNQRHAGQFDANKQCFSPASGSVAIQVEIQAAWFDGIQFDWLNVSGTYYSAIDFQPGSSETNCSCRIQNVLFKGNGGQAYAFNLGSVSTSSTGLIRNCILYDLDIGSSRSLIRVVGDYWTVDIINCTLLDSVNGIYEQLGTVNAYNNCVFNCTDDFNSVSGTVDYNASDDGDGTNAIAASGSDWANEFEDYTTYDLCNLATGNIFEGSALTNADDSNIPSVDIAGNARNTGAGENTTVGAFAVGEVGGGSTIKLRTLSLMGIGR